MAVSIERTGRVAELVMDRPEALNAISTVQARAIAAACAELAEGHDVSAVVITSTSAKAFCVGADLKERHQMSVSDLFAQRPVLASAFRGVLGLPMPVIAAVDGYALGAGFELALCCDLIAASPAAVFGLPETGIGLVPGGGGTQLLTRRIGASRAADLVFTGRRIGGAEADQLGIVDRFAEQGTARDLAQRTAVEIARNSPVALRAAKRALRGGADQLLADGLDTEDRAWREAVQSADRVEGIAAFNEKRAPRWQVGSAE